MKINIILIICLIISISIAANYHFEIKKLARKSAVLELSADRTNAELMRLKKSISALDPGLLEGESVELSEVRR